VEKQLVKWPYEREIMRLENNSKSDLGRSAGYGDGRWMELAEDHV
jgi:hypothetical protein